VSESPAADVTQSRVAWSEGDRSALDRLVPLVEETAEVTQVSPETVKRDWRLAKAWLSRRLSESAPDSNETDGH